MITEINKNKKRKNYLLILGEIFSFSKESPAFNSITTTATKPNILKKTRKFFINCVNNFFFPFSLYIINQLVYSLINK